MRTLTATLTAAQKALSARPAPLVELRNKSGPAVRLAWSSLYSGIEADSYHAATCPGDNSLVRARTDVGALYRQRVASPAAGSDYSIWIQIAVTLTAGKGIALASLGAKVALFYTPFQEVGKTLKVMESTDYGVTWGAAVTVATGADADFVHVSAVYISSNVLFCFFTTGAANENLWLIKRSFDIWGTPSAWPNSVIALTGISSCYLSDVNLLLTGKDGSSNYVLWGCVYGQGVNQAMDTWSALKEIRKTHSGTQVSYKLPFLANPDVLRGTFLEVFTGSESYNRNMGLHSLSALDFFSNIHHDDYRLPIQGTLYGVAIAYNATHVFLSTSKSLFWAPLAIQLIDVSKVVVSLRQTCRPFGSGVRPRGNILEVVLDNSKGVYNTPSFDQGWQIDFSPGFYTTLGAEYSTGQAFWIDSWEHISQPGKAYLRIIAYDAWGLLGRNQARSVLYFNASSNLLTYQGIVQRVLGLAGISLIVSSASSEFNTIYPKATLYQGQSFASFLEGLYDRLKDLLFVRGSIAYNINPSGSDASAYSYGAAGHPLFSGRYASSSLAANRFQVQGKEVYSDSFVQGQVDKVYTRYSAFQDYNADTIAKAIAIASALSTKELYHSLGGEIAINVNCGQELYDVIDITDSRAGLSASKRRVFGLDLLYDSAKGKYAMELILGGV